MLKRRTESRKWLKIVLLLRGLTEIHDVWKAEKSHENCGLDDEAGASAVDFAILLQNDRTTLSSYKSGDSV
jgi:hypothetical protein